jgi:pimeloyl-ACP methyl ester carboxylesterase
LRRSSDDPSGSALSSAHAPGRSIHLEVDGANLHVLEYGIGPTGGSNPSALPALLLHGGMAHSRWWDALAPLLRPALRCFALDRSGHGDSAWADPQRYGWERDLLDIEAVLRMLDPGPWVLIGHSQGGLLAVDVVTRARVPLAALVLVDIPLHPGAPRLQRTGETLRRIPQFRYASLEQAMRSFKPFPSPHRIPPPALRHLAEHSFKPTDDGGFTSKFHWAIFQRQRPEGPNPLAGFEARVARIPLPTLCVRGSESSILTADEHRQQVASLPRGRGVEIGGATHNPHVERPEETARAILSFVA